MKVALIHYRLLVRGGLETRLLNYIDYFHQRGDEVTVICAKKSEEVILPEGVSLKRLKLGLMPKPYRKLYFNHLLTKFMEEESFDFSLSLGRTGAQDAVLAAANHIGFLKSQGRQSRTKKDDRQIYLDQLSFDKSRIIYAASQMMKDELIAYYQVPGEKIHILFPPLNTRDYFPGLKVRQRELKAKWGMDPDKYSFLFVSASHERKGLPLLLKLFEKLQDEPFELNVAGYPKLFSELPNVNYLGFYKELRELYSAADCTIHPAIFEPFGQIISESLACGTPALVSHMVGAKEILDPAFGRVIDTFDPDVWLKEIREMPLRTFEIPDNIASMKDLSLKGHMERMLQLWEELD